jgi:hypothetical protein
VDFMNVKYNYISSADIFVIIVIVVNIIKDAFFSELLNLVYM